MPRDHRDDDSGEFERRYPQANKGLPVWAILLIVFGGMMAVGCVGSVALAFLGWVSVPGPAPMPPAGVPAKVWTREEFRTLVVGKAEEDVIKAVGRPDDTADHGESKTWYYTGLTRDPITGKIDMTISVRFRRGLVTEVDY